MDNNEQRDMAEEEYNRNLLRESDEDVDYSENEAYQLKSDKPIYSDEERESFRWWNFGGATQNWGTIDESAQEVEDRLTPYDPNPYQDEGDNRPESSNLSEWDDSHIYRNVREWDGSSTNQSNEFFVGHNGYVTTMWQVTNNPMEKYDPSKSYHLPARDGSALYVWFNMFVSDLKASESIEATSELLTQIGASIGLVEYFD